MSVITERYQILFHFLKENFHMKIEKMDTDKKIEHVIKELLIKEPEYIKELEKEFYFFLNLPVPDKVKEINIEKVVEIDMMGLKPIEFISYVYYRIKIEKNKRD